MKIFLNNKVTIIKKEMTIENLLSQIDVTHKYFAVEGNEQVIPKSSNKLFVIKEGDKIEIVTAIGGG